MGAKADEEERRFEGTVEYAAPELFKLPDDPLDPYTGWLPRARMENASPGDGEVSSGAFLRTNKWA